jgi:hypothetical protein
MNTKEQRAYKVYREAIAPAYKVYREARAQAGKAKHD